MKLNFSLFWPALLLALMLTAGIRWWRTILISEPPPSVTGGRAWVFLKFEQVIINSHSKIRKIFQYPQLLCVFTSSLHESFHKGKTILNFNFASPLPFHLSHHKIGWYTRIKILLFKKLKLISCSSPFHCYLDWTTKTILEKTAFSRMQPPKFSRAQDCCFPREPQSASDTSFKSLQSLCFISIFSGRHWVTFQQQNGTILGHARQQNSWPDSNFGRAWQVKIGGITLAPDCW